MSKPSHSKEHSEGSAEAKPSDGVTLTPYDVGMMQHALGVCRRAGRWTKPYRNHYCTTVDSPDYARWAAMVADGLATALGMPSEVTGGMQTYSVTERGKEIALAATRVQP